MHPGGFSFQIEIYCRVLPSHPPNFGSSQGFPNGNYRGLSASGEHRRTRLEWPRGVRASFTWELMPSAPHDVTRLPIHHIVGAYHGDVFIVISPTLAIL